MPKTKIALLNKGDSVLFVNDNFFAIQRKNGEVDLIRLYVENGGIPRLDTNNIVTVTYGKNTVETVVKVDNGGDVVIKTI